jgi:hypothetical protein
MAEDILVRARTQRVAAGKLMVEMTRVGLANYGHGLITIRPGVPLATPRYASWLSSRP